jgi:hypothetical protein
MRWGRRFVDLLADMTTPAFAKFLANAQWPVFQFSVFDAPLHYNFKEAADGGNAYDLRKIWDDTVVQRRPTDAV